MNDQLNDELNAARKIFCGAWKKHLENKPLEPLEKQIVFLIEQHPEYHDFFSHPEKHTISNLSDINENPFLHISLHLSILEQLTLNQPNGIKDIYQELILKHKGSHNADHIMMQCLQEMMSEALAKGEEPSGERFLMLLKKYI